MEFRKLKADRRSQTFLEREMEKAIALSQFLKDKANWTRLVSTGLASLDGILGGEGYPEKSVVIVVGPLGIGKEALGYWFTHSGLDQGDFCLYITRLSVSEILHDAKGFGVDFRNRVPLWFAVDGGQVKYDINDLTGLSYRLKEFLKENRDRRARIVVDSLSSLLMLNSPDTIYRFLTQLFYEVKQFDSVLLATLEEGMHAPQIIAAMGQLFDGVLELRMYEEGLRAVPLLKVLKMRGIPPKSFTVAFIPKRMRFFEGNAFQLGRSS